MTRTLERRTADGDVYRLDERRREAVFSRGRNYRPDPAAEPDRWESPEFRFEEDPDNPRRKRALQVRMPCRVPKLSDGPVSYAIRRYGIFSVRPVGAASVDDQNPNSDLAFYPDVWGQTDLRYSLTRFGVKEELILKGPGHPASFSWRVRAGLGEDLHFELDADGKLSWRTGRRKRVGYFPPPIIEGADGYAENLAWAWDGTTLSVSLPPDLSRFVYPITIDPTSTFNPDGDPESTSVDGRVQRAAADETWDDIHDGAGQNAFDSGSNDIEARVRATAITGEYDLLRRAIMLFDTSAIPSNSFIDAASIKLHVGTASDPDWGDREADIVASNPASNDDLVASDYENAFTLTADTVFASQALAGITTGQYTTWTLDQNGRDQVTPGGISKFGVRLDNDADDVDDWVSNADATFVAQSAENTNPPELSVTYTVPVVKVITETVNVQETIDSLTRILKSITETVNVQEGIDFFDRLLKVVDETVHVQETLARFSKTVKVVVEALHVQEIARRAQDFLDDLSTLFFWTAEYGARAVKGGPVTVSRDSSAWSTDQGGTWVEFLADTMRFTWRAVRGSVLRVVGQTELGRTNKCQRNVDFGTNGTTGWSGTATIVAVDDTEELRKAGLNRLVPDGQVLKVDNSAGTSTVWAFASGTTGNTNQHAVSAFVRGGGLVRVTVNGDSSPGYVGAPATYERISGLRTPSNSTNVFELDVQPGAVIYFVLSQLEEGGFVTSPIRNPTAGSVTRDNDSVYWADAPPPSPPLAIYAEFRAGYDNPPGAYAHWLTINESGMADPRFELRDHPTDGTFQAIMRDADGNGRTISLTPSPALVDGDRVQVLYLAEWDGSARLLLKVEDRTIQTGTHAALVSGLPRIWGATGGRVVLNEFRSGAEPGAHYPSTLKIFKRGHLNQTHIDGSDWDSLLAQARGLVLGPGGNLKGGGVSR